MDSIVMMERVMGETRRVVEGIDASQLDVPTPCSDWTVRDVLNHVVGGAQMFAISVRDGSVPDDQLGRLMTGDNLGTDFKASFAAAADSAESAIATPGVADKIVTLPFGQMPAGIALNIAVFDVTTHTWDLAKATGQDTALDPEVVGAALEVARGMLSDDMRAAGMFGPEVEVGPDAPIQDQLAAFTGRTP